MTAESRTESITGVLSLALDYARRGWRVFPLAPRSKVPIKGSRGFKDASTDSVLIRGWFTQWPTANLGIATGTVSGIVVLDVDPRHEGDKALFELEARHGQLSFTVESRTGSGGRHSLFAHPGGYIPCSEGKLGSGLDIKGDGGYVVAPPSIHPDSEQEYEWLIGQAPGDIELAPLPAWILEEIGKVRSTGFKRDERILKGKRNRTLFRIGAGLRRYGLAEEEIYEALTISNRRCDPPLSEKDLRGLAARAAKYSPGAEAAGQAKRDPDASTRFVSASRNYAEVLADTTPPAREIIEGHIFTVRQIGEWHGPDGARKSWELLTLLLMASIGRVCWHLPTRKGGIRCGYLSLEDEIDVVQSRLTIISLGMKLTEEEERLATENLHVIARPHLKDTPPFDIVQEASQEWLTDWIQANRLDLAVLDHLAAAAPSLPNEFDLRPVFLPALRIARDTDSGILFSHHDRKAAQGVRGRDRGASRGDTRFPAACRFRTHSERIGEENPDGTRIRLTFEKTTGGATPKPVHLLHRKDCPLEVTDAPKCSKERKASREKEALDLIRTAEPAGISASVGAKRLGVTPRTFERYVEELGEAVHSIGHGKNTIYRIATEGNVSGSCRESWQPQERQ